jgi:hypothetical protein
MKKIYISFITLLLSSINNCRQYIPTARKGFLLTSLLLLITLTAHPQREADRWYF